MASPNLILSNSSLLVATILTGLLAGTFFTWGNAVITGLHRLEDIAYLQAFQHMNRTILNPLFYVVFLGPLFFSIIATYQNSSHSPLIFKLVLSASLLYFVGVILVTILGNIPLNEMLNQTNLATIGIAEANNLRIKFEAPWNRLHHFRTIVSICSFGLLVVACLIKSI